MGAVVSTVEIHMSFFFFLLMDLVKLPHNTLNNNPTNVEHMYSESGIWFLTLRSVDRVQFLVKTTVFSLSLSKGLSLCLMCSDQHVKYLMRRGFSLISSLLLDYHVKQYIHILFLKLM